MPQRHLLLLRSLLLVLLVLLVTPWGDAFVVRPLSQLPPTPWTRTTVLAATSSSSSSSVSSVPSAANHERTSPSSSSTTTTTAATTPVAVPYSFIQTELRGAAMKLHKHSSNNNNNNNGARETSPTATTTTQAAATTNQATTTPTTHSDYRLYLLDSLRVYQAFEQCVDQHEALRLFRNTGLERTAALHQDIDYLTRTYHLSSTTSTTTTSSSSSSSSTPGLEYAAYLQSIPIPARLPEFMCHYYNFHFAHTAGGLMIGKQMSQLLLQPPSPTNQPPVVLQFYQWDGDLKHIKDSVKGHIEALAATWDAAEKQQCVDATAQAFAYGTAINGHLAGRRHQQQQ